MPFISRTDDPIADYNSYQDELQKKLDKLPECSDCDNPIQDDFAYRINDKLICEDCLNRFYRVSVDDFIESEDF